MDESSKKSNVVLLTVIAIVTMIVVVIGATFAYLASQVDGKGNSNINVTTNVSSDLFLIDAGSPIEIVANTENFGKAQAESGEDLSAESLGSITFTTSSDAESKRSYKIDLNISQNDMEYTSGTCYVKTSTVDVDKDSCTGNNIWATDGKEEKCYAKGNVVSSTDYLADMYSCTASDMYIWETREDAELVLDFYKVDNSKTQADCNTGKCYNTNRQVVDGITSEDACVGDNRWVADYFNSTNNKCYVLQNTYDITSTQGTLSLVNSAEMTTSKAIGKVNDYYMARVTLINYMHNQIQNGSKKFMASLEYSQILSEQP